MKRYVFALVIILICAMEAYAIPPSPPAPPVGVSGGSQPYDTELAALAGLTSAGNAIPYFTGSGTAGVISSSANMVSLLGSTDYATARTNLGLAIGTNVQAYDAELAAIAGLVSAAWTIPYFSGSGTAALVAAGTTGQILTATTGAAPSWSSTLSLATLDMTSATSSVPMTVTTSAGAQTTLGQMHFESDDFELSIGDGDATPIILDFAKDAAYVLPSSSATIARTDAAQAFTGAQSLVPQTINVTTEQDLTLTSSLVLIGGDNDSDNDTVDLQNGTTAGQIVIFVGISAIDADDTIIFNYGDTTCTGCAAVTFDDPGDVAMYVWTGTTWALIQHKAVD